MTVSLRSFEIALNTRSNPYPSNVRCQALNYFLLHLQAAVLLNSGGKHTKTKREKREIQPNMLPSVLAV